MLHAIEPRLHVSNLAESTGSFAQFLGFGVAMLWPELEPVFAILERDATRLQLVRAGGPFAESPGACTLWFDFEELNFLYQALEGRVPIEWGPEVFSYGRREFAFRDPDGHLLVCSEPAINQTMKM
jgi:hypothetical protein